MLKPRSVAVAGLNLRISIDDADLHNAGAVAFAGGDRTIAGAVRGAAVGHRGIARVWFLMMRARTPTVLRNRTRASPCTEAWPGVSIDTPKRGDGDAWFIHRIGITGHDGHSSEVDATVPSATQCAIVVHGSTPLLVLDVVCDIVRAGGRPIRSIAMFGALFGGGGAF